MVIVVATNVTDPNYIYTYGPFDSFTTASNWILNRLDQSRFSYMPCTLRKPESP